MSDMTARQRAEAFIRERMMLGLEATPDNEVWALERSILADREAKLARLVAASGMDVEGLADEIRKIRDEARYASKDFPLFAASRLAALIGHARETARIDTQSVIAALIDMRFGKAIVRPITDFILGLVPEQMIVEDISPTRAADLAPQKEGSDNGE